MKYSIKRPANLKWEERERRGLKAGKYVGTSLDKEAVDEIDAIAKKRGITRAEVVRMFVYKGLEE